MPVCFPYFWLMKPSLPTHIQNMARKKKKMSPWWKIWLRWGTTSPNAVYTIRRKKCLPIIGYKSKEQHLPSYVYLVITNLIRLLISSDRPFSSVHYKKECVQFRWSPGRQATIFKPINKQNNTANKHQTSSIRRIVSSTPQPLEWSRQFFFGYIKEGKTEKEKNNQTKQMKNSALQQIGLKHTTE